MANTTNNKQAETSAIAKTDNVTDVTKLDNHLARLYRDAIGAQDSDSAVPIVKVVLLNLIVYSETEEDANRAIINVGKIIGLHPCRSIVVDAIPTMPGEPPATVSLVCGITERGDRTLCGDIIHVHAHESAGVVGSVLPLLVPDVPVFLWITGDIPDENEDFDDLLDTSDYIIADSRRFEDHSIGFSKLLGLKSIDGAELAVNDLCWIALHAWRESIAQHFDPPSTRQYLAGLNEIIVRYSGQADEQLPPMIPTLLCAWLIERIGLDVAGASISGNECKIDAHQDGRSVKIRMIPEKSDSIEGRISSVTIKATGENGVATFFTQGSGSEVAVSEECAGICFPPRIIEIPPENEAYLVSQTLSVFKQDVLYMDAVQVVLSLMQYL